MTPEDKERLKKAIARLTSEIEVLVEKRMNEIVSDEEEEESVTKFEAGNDEDDD